LNSPFLSSLFFLPILIQLHSNKGRPGWPGGLHDYLVPKIRLTYEILLYLPLVLGFESSGAHHLLFHRRLGLAWAAGKKGGRVGLVVCMIIPLT
jgi:hypothetical protein